MYHDYVELKEKYGESAARTLVAFRRAHITEMLRVASDEDILKEVQVRETEHLDVFTCPTAFGEAKENLAKWRAEMVAYDGAKVQDVWRDPVELWEEEMGEQATGVRDLGKGNDKWTTKRWPRDRLTDAQLDYIFAELKHAASLVKEETGIHVSTERCQSPVTSR